MREEILPCLQIHSQCKQFQTISSSKILIIKRVKNIFECKSPFSVENSEFQSSSPSLLPIALDMGYPLFHLPCNYSLNLVTLLALSLSTMGMLEWLVTFQVLRSSRNQESRCSLIILLHKKFGTYLHANSEYKFCCVIK